MSCRVSSSTRAASARSDKGSSGSSVAAVGTRLRFSYEEKRNLVPTDASEDPLEPIPDPELAARVEALTRRLVPELWPLDYGRFEFRYDRTSRELLFMEVNLSCNLWSKKTISRSARTQGISHDQLVEHILAQSMARQGVIDRASLGVAQAA